MPQKWDHSQSDHKPLNWGISHVKIGLVRNFNLSNVSPTAFFPSEAQIARSNYRNGEYNHANLRRDYFTLFMSFKGSNFYSERYWPFSCQCDFFVMLLQELTFMYSFVMSSDLNVQVSIRTEFVRWLLWLVEIMME